jgi:hypothetical protein
MGGSMEIQHFAVVGKRLKPVGKAFRDNAGFYVNLAGEVEFSAGARDEVGVTNSHPPIHSCRSNC